MFIPVLNLSIRTGPELDDALADTLFFVGYDISLFHGDAPLVQNPNIGRFYEIGRCTYWKTKSRLTVFEYSIKKRVDKSPVSFIVRYMSNNTNIPIEQLADIFKALSNPNRLKIFLLLTTCCRPGTVGIYDKNADVDTMFIGDLGKELEVGKPTVSHHIKELRRVGIIRTERRGQNIACWVDPGVIEQLRAFFTR